MGVLDRIRKPIEKEKEESNIQMIPIDQMAVKCPKCRRVMCFSHRILDNSCCGIIYKKQKHVKVTRAMGI